MNSITQSSAWFHKRISLQNYTEVRAKIKSPLVWTNGCFDIIHRGHIEYLAACKALGGSLVVGLNSDASIKRIKGEKRPIIQEEDRFVQLAAFSFIDYIVIFEEDTPLKWIERMQPDLLVKGGDYPISEIVGREVVLARGGEVKTIPFVTGKSSTNIIETIVERYGKNT